MSRLLSWSYWVQKSFRAFALFGIAFLCGCTLNQVNEKASLIGIGTWVEIEGHVASTLHATEIDEKERGRSDTRARAEMTAPIDSMNGTRLQIGGRDIQVSEETEFEDIDSHPVAPFLGESGDWMKVKTLRSEDGTLTARVIRRAEVRDRFEIEGEILSYSEHNRSMNVGGYMVHLDPSTDVTRLEVKEDDPSSRSELSSPLALFQGDEQKGVPFNTRIGESLFFGGQVSTEIEHKRNYDLDRSDDRDDTDTQFSIKGDVLWAYDDNGSFALLEVTGERSDDLKQGRRNEQDGGVTVSRAYTYVALSDEWRIQFGRQDFDEEREWIYDERLDGLRFIYRGNPIEFESSLSVGREWLDEGNETEDIVNLIGLARYYFNDDHHASVYVIDRRDTTDRDFSPFLFGVRSFGRPKYGLRHWLELARADGVVGPERLDGYATDVGISYAFDHDLRPTLSAGWAYATGDDDLSDDRGPFRQSGLQDNNGKFGGVSSFRYYGEVLDPELSNLSITTLALGIRPTRNSSIDLVAHHYRHNEVSSTLFDDLRASPNGTSRDVGWEIDVIFGLRSKDRYSLEVVVGRLAPGHAFDDRDPAYLAQFQFRYKF